MQVEIAADNMWEAFEEIAQKFPSKRALVYLGNQWTYAELKDSVEKLAASLRRLGLGEGDKAIIYLTNLPQWIIAWLALQRLGSTPVPITPIYTPRDLKYIANDSGAETIFCLDTNFGYVAEVLPETGLKRVIVTTMVELLPGWKRFIGKAFNRIPEGRFSRGGNIFTFKSLLKSARLSLPPVKSQGKDLCQMYYTGGTLGLPKGVPLSHALLLKQAVPWQRRMSEPEIPKGEDVALQSAPLFHVLGGVVMLAALLSGDTLVLLARMNLDGAFDHIQRYKIKSIFGVPTFYRNILEHDRVDYYDLKSLKYCFCAGDVLPLEISGRWYRKFGISISPGYGATETGAAVAMTYINEKPPEGSAGKILLIKKVKLLTPETLEPVPPGEAGELLVSSDHMVTAYWNKPDETAKCFVDMEGRLWYRTGDIVRIDKDGWFFFLDRSADMIKHKGYRVAASEIETVLQEHPAVVASCAIGVPDARLGERIKAFVVLKEDVKGVSGYDLMRWCRERLAPYKVPEYIEFRDMLPKTKVGKVLRREMRADELKKFENDKWES